MANTIWNELLQQGLIGLQSVFNRAYSWLPQIIFALIFICAGFIIGGLLKWVIVKVSDITKFNELTKRTGTNEALKKIGYKGTPASLFGDISKFFIYVLFIAGALQILLGSEFLAQIISAVAMYAPKVIAAIVILVSGLILGDIFGKMIGKIIQNLVMQTKSSSAISTLSETLTKILIFAVAAIISLAMIGVYVDILTIGFAITFFGIILFVLVGTRDMLPNFFAGLYLQGSNKIHKGMEIGINNQTGQVIEIGLAFTILKTKNGELQIPNAKLFREIINVIE